MNCKEFTHGELDFGSWHFITASLFDNLGGNEVVDASRSVKVQVEDS
jgi:hypothetical protein